MPADRSDGPAPVPSGEMRLPTLGGGLRMMRRAGMVDTMRAWEGFLTGDPRALLPLCNFVVSSWQRSLLHGVNPAGRSAPLAARDENDMVRLRDRHQDLLSAAAGVLTDALELFAGSRSIMILTNADGIVLEAVGDMPTLEQGQDIHLMPGGDWREGVIGTNGIGTALAAGRPAQVHAAEHFCEGIKRWTCAAAPVFEPGTGAILGVVDISGPPMTYQRNNLALAVMAARQIEAVLSGRAAEERSRLLECCLERLSMSDAAGLIALDRTGRLVHATGRVPVPVALGQRMPGLDGGTSVDDWPRRLPEGWPSGTFTPVKVDGRTIGALLVMPTPRRSNAGQLSRPGSPQPAAGDRFGQIIGTSDAVRRMVERGRMLAGRRVPVLIEGETGTGKELLARAMHEADDPRKPFVVLNCGALSKELMAGELFGHVRGAFTGATSEGRAGRFELAHGGTLCLDEIGELPLDLQPVLLRAVEEGMIYRLGDPQPRPVDVRLMAITNRRLPDEVAAGRFRRDLFHRLSVTAITVPPLRDRDGDIETLAEHFNQTLAARHGVAMRRFSPDAIAALRAYGWPGNLRELRNVIESLLLTSDQADVGLADLPDAVAGAAMELTSPDAPGVAECLSLDRIERASIEHALQQSNRNMFHAARALGISRSTLYRKIARYGLRG